MRIRAFLALLAVAPAVGAQVEAPSTPTSTSPAEPRPVVVLALRGDALPTEPLIAALAEELGKEVVLETASGNRAVEGVLTVNYRLEPRELAVTWDSAGRTISRVITASEKLEGIVQDSALLAGNLAREQLPSSPPPVPAPPAVIASPAPTAAPPTAPAPVPPRPVVNTPPKLLATASLIFPIATNYRTPDATSQFDFNLLSSRIGAVDGVQLGGVNVITRERGAFLKGLQIGWLINVVRGGAAGIQLAPGANLTSGEVHGLQAAGLMNRAEALNGLQLGGVNVAAGDVKGAQLGGVNVAGNVIGPSLGLVNVADDVDGVQLGLVNIAAKVRGSSIGLVNVADDIEGVPFGLISVTKTGGIHPLAWSGTSGYANVGLKFATRRTYTVFFGAMHRKYGLVFGGGGVALGVRIPLIEALSADADLGAAWLGSPSLSRDGDHKYHEQLLQPRLRLLLSYRVAKHLGFFLGGAALSELRSEHGWGRVTLKVGPELVGGIEL